MKEKVEVEIEGLVFNIQRFSLHDGPGIRSTVFLKGCPLRCRWCSNPESMNVYPEIMTFDIKCIKCGKCVPVCPSGAISLVAGKREIDWSRCNQCLKCVEVCPSGAIQQMGKSMTVSEVFTEVEKDILFYKNSNGGVTFSGGEPLLQWKFVRDIARQCKLSGIHTALDTSGYARWEVIQKVLDYIDLVLFDIKHIEQSKHGAGTGVRNQIILQNLARSAEKVKIWLRIPVIAGFNDSKEFISEVADIAEKFKVDKVSLLSYHQWGMSKYARLGRTCPCSDIEVPSEQKIQAFNDLMQSRGLNATIGR
jgi:pyruvate formate lyase activating enzyme